MVLCKPKLSKLTKTLMAVFISCNFYLNPMESDNADDPYKDKYPRLLQTFDFNIIERENNPEWLKEDFANITRTRLRQDSNRRFRRFERVSN